MATTTIQPLPYPAPGDSPDVPRDLKALAEAVEGRTVMRFASTAARDAALPSGKRVAGMHAYIEAENGVYVWGGGAWMPSWAAAPTQIDLLTHAEYRIGATYRHGIVTLWARGSNTLATNVTWPVLTGIAGHLRPVGGGAEGVLRPSAESAPIGSIEVSTDGNVRIHNRGPAVSAGWQGSTTYVTSG